ncbi:TRAP transporter small permease [Dysosmobacter sp.]|uniref:TRAP transporter small permease n=1 Tax=Dysosmobacter sp. TaxID=2591382 RepID=UPI002D7EB184|nr:TRAP transporter small permease [Dysosmobacter sp.]MCI6053759.1 TRAP transporter small permease [Dysosmobacter sp.]
MVLMMAAMTVVIIAQVICRVVHGSIPWSEEFSRFLMIYITFLGMAYACRYDQLMSVKFLQMSLPELGRKILYAVALFIQIAFFSAVFYQGIAIMQTVHTQISPALRIPMSLPYSAMMVGSVLAVINCLYLLIFHIFNIPVSFSPEDKEGTA